MTTNQNQPVKKINDGRITAAIWKNFGEKGTFYSVTITRSFKDEQGNWKDTDSFSGTDLLKVSRLSLKAYDAIEELRASDRDDLLHE
ncbi:MAG: hypothetical protein AAFR78_03550 [Planctomycetota bacterium]